MNTTHTDSTIRPFHVDVPQADLDDLRERLARTRLPQAAPADDWRPAHRTPICAKRSTAGAAGSTGAPPKTA